MTAGRGKDSAGDVERRIDGDDAAPNDDRRLCDGGFIGRGSEVGVPGAEGSGDPAACEKLSPSCARTPKSGAAGGFDDILRAGRSILATLLCCARENWPSFVRSLYM